MGIPRITKNDAVVDESLGIIIMGSQDIVHDPCESLACGFQAIGQNFELKEATVTYEGRLVTVDLSEGYLPIPTTIIEGRDNFSARNFHQKFITYGGGKFIIYSLRIDES